MSYVIPASRSSDARGRLPRLGYFVLVSLLLHALLVALWRGEPSAGPVGQSTFQITLLARHGDTPGRAGAAAGQMQNGDTQPSMERGESSDEPATADAAESGKPLMAINPVADVQPVPPALPALARPGTRSHSGVKKPRHKTPAVTKAQWTKRLAARTSERIGAAPGSASDGQQQLNSVARYRRVRTALEKALLPRFDYPSVARRRGWQGRVRIGLHVEADGDLTRIHLLESSGHALLDRAAVKNVTELRNVPAVTQWLDGLDMDVILPVSYRLHDR